MELANYWEPIYLLVTSTLLLFAIQQYDVCDYIVFYTRKQNNFGGLLIAIAISVFVGLRPLSAVFADMVNYNNGYKWFWGSSFLFDWSTENIIFDNLWMWMSSHKIPVVFFYLLCDLIYFCTNYWVCKKMFPKDYLAIFLVNLTAFSTFSSSTNGFKGGIAASVFLLALAYSDKKWISIVLALISCGFHHSMKVVLLAYFVAALVKNMKWYYYLWIFCFLIALFHISYFQNLFGHYVSDRSASYLIVENPENTYLTGFRLDFILYGVSPIAVCYYLNVIKKIQCSETYLLITRLYIITNSLWMLCMYAAFTNRIAALSWFMLPVLLVYPFFSFYWNERQLIYGKKAAIYHMAFTLFMFFVYYTFLH